MCEGQAAGPADAELGQAGAATAALGSVSPSVVGAIEGEVEGTNVGLAVMNTSQTNMYIEKSYMKSLSKMPCNFSNAGSETIICFEFGLSLMAISTFFNPLPKSPFIT